MNNKESEPIKVIHLIVPICYLIHDIIYDKICMIQNTNELTPGFLCLIPHRGELKGEITS